MTGGQQCAAMEVYTKTDRPTDFVDISLLGQPDAPLGTLVENAENGKISPEAQSRTAQPGGIIEIGNAWSLSESHFPFATSQERKLDLLWQEQTEPNPFDFKQDLKDQSAWLVEQCRARFDCTPDELLQRPGGSEQFHELAVEWREAHPRS